jgi:hypothetical protein
MNELAVFVPFIYEMQECRITDKNGDPWFAAKDVCAILGLKNPSDRVKDFPPDEVAIITTISSTYSGKKRPIPHKLLIINTSGLMRLIDNSRKPEAKPFKEQIIKLTADFINYGLRRAVLPKTWGKENLTWGEWVAKKEKNYFRKHPDATFEDFLRTLPNRE